jgi:hypothetical protein
MLQASGHGLMLTDLDVATAVEQDVVTLDVSVDDVQVVQVL